MNTSFKGNLLASNREQERKRRPATRNAATVSFLAFSATLVFAALTLGGCATNDAPEYRVGGSGPAQARAQAEQRYAAMVGTSSSAKSFDQPPKVLSAPFPDYPKAWQNANIVGNVVLHFTIDSAGKVVDPQVVGFASPELAALCLHTVMRWRYTPAMKDGVAVSVRAGQTFVFKVE